MKYLSTGLLILAFFLANAQKESVISGADAFYAKMKTTCGTSEKGVTRYGIWEGKGYSRIPGEKDRHLFNVIGINTRACDVKEDDVRGKGYRSVSREVMMYLDPKTGEILDTWDNPFTGKQNTVVHVANDPVNMRAYSYEKTEEGEYSYPLTLRNYGELSMSSYEIPLFYDNPLKGEYQVYVGGAYHAMEIFNTTYHTDEILDSAVKRLSKSYISWARHSQWLPWMEMGSKPGMMIFNATGYSTFDKAEIWEKMQSILDERYPDYNMPPPLDDPRPNETSWTVFEKFMEGKEKKTVRGTSSH